MVKFYNHFDLIGLLDSHCPICFYGGGAKVTQCNGMIQNIAVFWKIDLKMNLFKIPCLTKRLNFLIFFVMNFVTWYAAFGIVTPVARELQIWKDAGPTMRSWHVLKTNYQSTWQRETHFGVGFLRIFRMINVCTVRTVMLRGFVRKLVYLSCATTAITWTVSKGGRVLVVMNPPLPSGAT